MTSKCSVPIRSKLLFNSMHREVSVKLALTNRTRFYASFCDFPIIILLFGLNSSFQCHGNLRPSLQLELTVLSFHMLYSHKMLSWTPQTCPGLLVSWVTDVQGFSELISDPGHGPRRSRTYLGPSAGHYHPPLDKKENAQKSLLPAS